jgi:hypothetical protein
VTGDEIPKYEPPLVTFRVTPEQAEFLRVTDDGALEIPLSIVRELSDWLKRYDMRPKPGMRGPIVERKMGRPHENR